MSFISGEPLPRVFTNDFRIREGFTDKDAIALVARMQEAVRAAHDHRAIMADANELNWIAVLAGKNGPEPRVIDVDSWAIGNWPAQVLMPSIKDWHTKGFNELTDWFAWGVVSFQVFTGIHPYKGTLTSFAPGDLEGRMKANASVFRKGVRLNRAVRDFSKIPGPLLDWYVETFERGTRAIPPSPFVTGAAKAPALQVVRMVTTKSGSLVYDLLYRKVGDRAIQIFPCGVVLFASGSLVNLWSKREIASVKYFSCEVARVEDGWLIAERGNGGVKFSYVNEHSLIETELVPQLKITKVMRYENRLFAITDEGVAEIVFRNLGKPIISFGHTWRAMVNATKWFHGVGIQDAMGAAYLILPFGEKECAHVRVRELDGCRPVSARAGERIVSIIAAEKKGKYQKFEFYFDDRYTTYSVLKTDVDTPEMNIAILPKGVCATIIDDGELVISVPRTGVVNTVSDKGITSDMMLSCVGDKVVYTKDGEVWWVHMK